MEIKVEPDVRIVKCMVCGKMVKINRCQVVPEAYKCAVCNGTAKPKKQKGKK